MVEAPLFKHVKPDDKRRQIHNCASKFIKTNKSAVSSKDPIKIDSAPSLKWKVRLRRCLLKNRLKLLILLFQLMKLSLLSEMFERSLIEISARRSSWIIYLWQFVLMKPV